MFGFKLSSKLWRVRQTVDFYASSLKSFPRFIFYLVKRSVTGNNKRVDRSITTCIKIQNTSILVTKNNLLYERTLELPWNSTEKSPWNSAFVCHRKFGFYPISFVGFREASIFGQVPKKINLISPIIPGQRYSFDDESQYLKEYQEAIFAFTFRKSGWDSYRNIEILENSCIPIFLDADHIPRFSMTFYPKYDLYQISRKFQDNPFKVETSNLLEWITSARRFLTPSFLYNYISSFVNFDTGAKLIFLDESLDGRPDYQSLMVLFSLVKNHGSELDTLWDYRYLFEDIDNKEILYGKGFGYYRQLVDYKINNIIGSAYDLEDYDFIVIGSCSRNLNLVSHLPSRVRHKVVLIHGEDFPPTRKELKLFHEKSDHIFIRAIDHPFVVP